MQKNYVALTPTTAMCRETDCTTNEIYRCNRTYS